MPFSGKIIQLLAARNPTLDLRRQPPGRVTQNTLYRNLDDSDVEHWSDFSYANIEAAYGHLFDIGPVTCEARNPRATPTEIEKEGHVDDLTLLWNWEVCREPLKRGADKVQSDLGIENHDISMKHLGQQSKDPGSDCRVKAPDWSIFSRDEGRTVLLWGDSKCSSKWSSQIDEIPAGLKANWIWPFRQMLTYCVNDSTRYGYILTPEEVVVLRVYEDNATQEYPWRVQYTSVPWTNAGLGILTVNLSIWALAMMALNQDHRPIRGRQDTLPLNAWWTTHDASGSLIHEHHLSNRKLLTLPSGAQASVRPTTVPQKRAHEDSGRSSRSRKPS